MTDHRFIRGSPRRLTAIQVLITIGLSVFVYANALENDFVYDDIDQVVNNFAIRDASNLPRIFAEDVWSLMGEGRSNYYRPIMHSVYMLNYAVFGLDPRGFHLVNILLHCFRGIRICFDIKDKYSIYIKKNKDVLLWKDFNKNMAVSVEYNLEY